MMLSAVVWNDVDVLEKAGHEIRLEAISDWNVVELIVHEQQVFNCDIRDLDFGERRISYLLRNDLQQLIDIRFPHLAQFLFTLSIPPHGGVL